MRWRGDSSVRTKLSLVLGIAISLIVLVGTFGWTQLRSVNEVTSEVRERWLPRLEMLNDLNRWVELHWLMSTSQLGTSNFHHMAEIARGTTRARASVRLFSGKFEKIDLSSVERKLFDRFESNWQHYLEINRGISAKLDAGELQGAILDFNTRSRNAFDAALNALKLLTKYAEHQSEQTTLRAENLHERALILTIIVTIGASLCAFAAVSWSNRNVSAPILQTAQAMRRLNAGDLTLTIDDRTDRPDEIGTLIRSVKSFRESLLHAKELSVAAEIERQRLQAAVSNMPIGLCMVDSHQRLIICNARFAELYELEAELTRPGTPMAEIAAQCALKDALPWTPILDQADPAQPASYAIELPGDRIVSVIRQPMADGGWVATHQDVTEQRRAAAQIAYLAHHDPLTDLPNRLQFRKRLGLALRGPHHSLVGVIFLDLDRFKNVNDTLGHLIGDKLLTAVARRLRCCVSDRDAVARVGGDEFAIVQLDVTPGQITDLAQRLIAAISEPFMIDGHRIVVGMSAGIASSGKDAADADTLLKNADLALYAAKCDGRGTCRMFEEGMAERARVRRTTELDLHRALEHDEFELFYQPFVRLDDYRICGVEALLRWRHSQTDLIRTPAEFVPIAEENGLIVPLGRWVLERACLEAASWPAGTRVAVNVSAVQFGSRELVRTIEAALAQAGLSPSRLEIEVTETALLEDSETTLANLHDLHAMGVRIALDDFGTGYSSLLYLRSFPFQRIKIDGSFIRHIETRDGSAAIIRAITGLGTGLGMETTAEGVETIAQLDFIRMEGCTEAQGYLFSMPVVGARIAEILQSSNVRLMPCQPRLGIEEQRWPQGASDGPRLQAEVQQSLHR